MGSKGVKRKVEGAGMFAKLMYLAELEEFIPRMEVAPAPCCHEHVIQRTFIPH